MARTVPRCPQAYFRAQPREIASHVLQHLLLFSSLLIRPGPRLLQHADETCLGFLDRGQERLALRPQVIDERLVKVAAGSGEQPLNQASDHPSTQRTWSGSKISTSTPRSFFITSFK